MLAISILSLASAAFAYTEVSSANFMYKNIDPIVYPGSLTKSHLHTFFGSDTITANTSKSSELRTGCTTAENQNDLSTYWIPTLLVTSGPSPIPVAPMRFSAYYENNEDAEIPFPENFKSVAGKSNATDQESTPELAKVSWYCENAPAEDKDYAAFPSKTCPTHLQHLLYFPDCVNPTTLEYDYSGTQNWKGNFKPANRCPSGMKRIPRLRFSIRYDLRKVLSKGWSGRAPLTLSSGSSYTAHGDFFNGWDTEAAKNMLKATGRDFVSLNGSKGSGSSGAPKCKAKDADPSQGTSDYETSKALMGKRSLMRRWVA